MKFATLLTPSSVYRTPFSNILQWAQWSQRKWNIICTMVIVVSLGINGGTSSMCIQSPMSVENVSLWNMWTERAQSVLGLRFPVCRNIGYCRRHQTTAKIKYNVRLCRRVGNYEKIYLRTSAPNEDSNQPVHSHSLIRVFVVGRKKLCILGHPKCTQWRFWSDCANADSSEGTLADVTAHLHKCIDIPEGTVFIRHGSYSWSTHACGMQSF